MLIFAERSTLFLQQSFGAIAMMGDGFIRKVYDFARMIFANSYTATAKKMLLERSFILLKEALKLTLLAIFFHLRQQASEKKTISPAAIPVPMPVTAVTRPPTKEQTKFRLEEELTPSGQTPSERTEDATLAVPTLLIIEN